MKRFLIVLLAVVSLLVGCNTKQTDFYVVCRQVDGKVYITNGKDYYMKTDLGLIKVPQDTMVAKPMLRFKLRNGKYKFKQTSTPTVYRATFHGLEIYISNLINNYGGTYTIEYADANEVRGSFQCESFKVRFVYTEPDYLRLYAVDKLDKPIDVPYKFEGEKIKGQESHER